MDTIDTDVAFAAFDRRDRTFDGKFVGAVKTTGIYCKPSCPARRPLRENVEFFATGALARSVGYRACLRCHPDDVARDESAVKKAVRLLSKKRRLRWTRWLKRSDMRRIIFNGCSNGRWAFLRQVMRER